MENNYLPLFRKYRPQSFKDVVGQSGLVKALTNAIELNRIANAYLFCGPRGTGKTSCARIFAKSLNCQSGPTIAPCQKCASCIDITNASGLDVIEIDAASNRGIQDAKELISQVQYAPINGKYKIFIIDEVHMLSNDAFNALLKTFEEPPKNVIFILATTEPHKVLETIVSRCQRFDFRRITTDDIIKRLREISDIENIKITDSALFTIAKNVSGGMRDSLALLDQVSILGIKETIEKELIEDLLGKINFDVLLNLLLNITQKNIVKAVEDVNKIYSNGNEPRNLAENFIEFLRNVSLVVNSSEIDEIKDFTSMIDENIQNIKSCSFDSTLISKILNTMIEYYKEIKVSTNPYLWMELAVIAACSDFAVQNIQNIQSRQTVEIKKPTEIKVEKPEAKEINEIAQTQTQIPQENIKPKESESEITEVQNPQKQTQIDNQDGASIWTNILSNIKSPLTKALYSGTSKLVKVENNVITLGYVNENALNGAKNPSKFKALQDTVESLYPDYKIELIIVEADTKCIEVNKKQIKQSPQSQVVQDSKNLIQNQQIQPQIKQEQSETSQSADEEMEETKENKHNLDNYSPKVKDMIEQFNGRIIE